MNLSLPNCSLVKSQRMYLHRWIVSISKRMYCSASGNVYVPFETMVNTRRAQARRSFLVQLSQSSTVSSAHKYYCQYGEIENMFISKNSEGKNILLIEFNEEKSIENLIEDKNSSHSLSYTVPYGHFNSSDTCHDSLPCPVMREDMSGAIHRKKFIDQHTTISEQIQGLCDNISLNETSSRLRFMLCRKLEHIVPLGMGYARALPFGSSVNSFGRLGCDLDVYMDFNRPRSKKIQENQETCFVSENFPERIERKGSILILLEEIMRHIPGFGKIKPIRGASTPIIEFRDDFTKLECDLSCSNSGGTDMSAILYHIAHIDPRVRPMIMFIRYWGQFYGLTGAGNQQFPTNLSITMLVLFYLMNTPVPVIPNIETCLSQYDIFSQSPTITIQNSNNTNNSSLDELLEGFFNFYASFNFQKWAISPLTGQTIHKPSYNPLHIEYPLATSKNVSKNVKDPNLKSLVNHCRSAAHMMNDRKDANFLFEKLLQKTLKNTAKNNRQRRDLDIIFEEFKQEAGKEAKTKTFEKTLLRNLLK